MKRYETLLINLGRNLFIVFLLAFILDLFPFFNISGIVNMWYFFYITLVFGLISVLLYFRSSITKVVFKYIFLILLVLVALSSLDFLGDFLSKIQLHLTILTIIFGVFTFYLHRDLIDHVEKEKDQEEKKELQRRENFHKDHPTMDKIPILRYILKWMYGEGWWYSLGLVLLFLIGLIIRLWNLDKLPPYPDEYAHLIAGRDLLGVTSGMSNTPVGGFLGVIDVYSRGFLLVTLPTLLSFAIFGPALWSARLVSVFFNILTVIPLYFIVKRINKKMALISVLLFVTNPWIIAVSRNIREYAIFPFYFALVVLFMFYLFKKIPKRIHIKMDLFSLFKVKNMLLFLVFLLPIIYAKFIDPASTFKFVLLIYAIFMLFLLFRLNFKDKFNLKVLGLIIPIGIVFGVFFILSQSFVQLIPEFSNFGFDLLFNNPTQQWYYNVNSVVAYVAISFTLLYSILAKKRNALFFLLLFAASLYFFTFHFDRYFRPRYGFPIELFFLIVLAIGLYLLYKNLTFTVNYKNLLKKGSMIFLTILIISSMFNLSQTYLATDLHNNYGGTYVPITNEHHARANKILGKHSYLLNESELILFDSINHLKWFFPEIYKNKKVINYNCVAEGYNKTKLQKANDKRTVLISVWRANRGGCIEKNDVLKNRTEVFVGEGYYIYKNFD